MSKPTKKQLEVALVMAVKKLIRIIEKTSCDEYCPIDNICYGTECKEDCGKWITNHYLSAAARKKLGGK